MMESNQTLLIIILCLSTVAFSSCNKRPPAPKPKSDSELMNLKGKVKSVHETSYLGYAKKPIGFAFSAYNIDGNLTESIDSTVDVSVSRTQIKYDGQGRKVEDAFYGNGRLWNKTTYKYDTYGYLTEECHYDSLGKREGKKRCIYNNNGNMAEADMYTLNDVISVKVFREYDERNNLKMEKAYKNDSLDHTAKYMVDAKGKMLEEAYYNAKRIEYTRFTYRYDSSGNKIEECSYSGKDTLDSKTIRKYDKWGNDTDEVLEYYYPRALHVEYADKYEYDSLGNWVKQLSYTNGSPGSIVKRQIEYYK